MKSTITAAQPSLRHRDEASEERGPRWIGEVDFLRGFAILAVIGIHASLNFTPFIPMGPAALVLIHINTALQFAVPLFIFISGFVISLKYRGRFPVKPFYRKRAGSILPQYAVFSAIYVIGTALLLRPVSLLQAAYGFLTASCSYHLWFIAVIAELYLLYPFLIRLYDRLERDGKEKHLLLLCLALQVAWNALWFASMDFAPAYVADLLRRVFLTQIFFFVAGIYAARHYGSLEKDPRLRLRYLVPVALALTLVVSSALVMNVLQLGQFPIISIQTLALLVLPRALEPVLYTSAIGICFIASVRLVETKSLVSSALRSLGKYSFGIYLIHAGLLLLVDISLGRAGITPGSPLFAPALFGIALALSYLSVYLISFLPYSTLLVGTHNEAPKKAPG